MSGVFSRVEEKVGLDILISLRAGDVVDIPDHSGAYLTKASLDRCPGRQFVLMHAYLGRKDLMSR